MPIHAEGPPPPGSPKLTHPPPPITQHDHMSQQARGLVLRSGDPPNPLTSEFLLHVMLYKWDYEVLKHPFTREILRLITFW